MLSHHLSSRYVLVSQDTSISNRSNQHQVRHESKFKRSVMIFKTFFDTSVVINTYCLFLCNSEKFIRIQKFYIMSFFSNLYVAFKSQLSSLNCCYMPTCTHSS